MEPPDKDARQCSICSKDFIAPDICPNCIFDDVKRIADKMQVLDKFVSDTSSDLQEFKQTVKEGLATLGEFVKIQVEMQVEMLKRESEWVQTYPKEKTNDDTRNR